MPDTKIAMPDTKIVPIYPPVRTNGTGGFYAVVASDGTLYRGFRALSAKWHRDGEDDDAGYYSVTFNASVDRAAYAVTVSCPDPMQPTEPPGYFASAALLAGSSREVKVRIWKPGPGQGATSVKAGFHLLVLAA